MKTLSQPDTWASKALIPAATVSWLQAFQQAQYDAFLQRGLPTRRDEEWKYTDVSPLAGQTFVAAALPEIGRLAEKIKQHRLKQSESVFVVLINGIFVESLSDLALLEKDIVLCSITQAIQHHGDTIKPYIIAENDHKRSVFANLNAALCAQGIYLHIPKRTVVRAPIQLLYFYTGQESAFITNPRQVIIADESSQVTLCEEHVGDGASAHFSNIKTDIYMKKNAIIDYYKIQNDAHEATHIAHTVVEQQQDSQFRYCALQKGAQLARDTLTINLNERGASSSVNGFYGLQRDGQHVDNHVEVNHIAPHGTSHMLYKGILDGQSHGVFNGKIFVHQGAQKTESYQANHNWLLSSKAAIDTKPEFEIYADDVKCAHGDTVGQMDTDALFYLRARGIDKDSAMQLLLWAFAEDVMRLVTHPAIANHMNTLLRGMMHHDSGF